MNEPLVLFGLLLLAAIALGVLLAWLWIHVLPFTPPAAEFDHPLYHRKYRDAATRRPTHKD
ncbi:hypothetical protein SAMN04487926_12125 [Paraburkholderia steynii]|uniref:Uncharacterized protein n=1 Tax=Paraburkholderia steynii TaxID=1245441 RepID=A0A7Z7BCZ0_9BURK|nr:hypothetical protein [Paraburkholderia steynii]SDI64664.1 hypothetical protein SAMN04487926_12125 [Paraburkholderia steynii]